MVNIRCVDDQDLEQHFTIHKGFITHYSAYYNRMFNGRFLEGQTQSTDQFPISVEAFNVFVKWLYTQTLEDSEGAMPSIKDLINLWILADEKLVPVLQNNVMEALNDEIAKTQALPTDLFGLVYEHTSEDSQLRKFLVDQCIGQVKKMKIEDHFLREMLVDLLKAGAESKPTKAAKLSKEKIRNYFVSEDVQGPRGGSTISDSDSIGQIQLHTF
jgi:hypothetical protein